MTTKNSSTRGKRYDDYRKLRSATRAWCVEYVRQRGLEWTPGLEAELRDDTSESPALDAWQALEDAVLVAHVVLAKHPHADDLYIVQLRRAVAALPWMAYRTSRSRAVPRRQLLVMEYDRPRCWWWQGRPKPRDLAVLSILAGEFPLDWAKKRTVKDAPGVTVAETMEAEERAVRSALESANPT